MTDFKRLREEYVQFCSSIHRDFSPPTKAVTALLDRAIAEDDNSQRTPALGIHYNYTDHYVEGLKAEIAALARKLADERERTKRVAEKAAAEGWDNGHCCGRSRYDSHERRRIDVPLVAERALANA